MTTILTTKITTTALPKADERKNNALTTPSWQVFQSCNSADRTRLEMDKTYIMVYSSGSSTCDCLIEKSRSTKILLGSPDCFEFGCGTSETCDPQTKGWLTHKTSCKTRNGCSYTTLRVEGSGNSPEASIRCGAIEYEERPTADEPSAKDFCRSKPTANTVRLLCYPEGAAPKMFTLNRPILPDDYTQNGLGKKYSYSVQYQGPYKLLEPYRPEYKPSDGCGCVVKLVSHVKIEIHSQGDCVRVQCTDPLCRLKHDAANDVYTVNSPGSFNVRYNNSRTCTSDRMTYFLAQVNAPGVINYRCGAVGRVRVAKKRPIFKSQALKRKKPKSKLSKIVPGGKPPEAEVFQTCSYLPEAKLTKNKNYALVATKNSCYCLIRKPASDNFVTGSNMCTEVWCKNGKSCINSKEIWINYSPRCSKIDKCGRSLFKIEGSGRSSDASITCGLAKFQSVRTPSSFCQNKQVWHDVVVECYEQKIPVTRLWVASPHSRATPAADTKFIQYNISYQGPYKLLDPYKVGSRVSGSCQCVLDIVGNVDVRVYPGCSCVSVKCAGKNKCKILTTTQGGFIIKGRNEIRVAYKNKAACRKCEQTYFLATGEKGKIAYGCGLGSKVKAHSPTTTTTTTTTLAPTSQADEPKEYSVKPGQPIIPTFHPVQASNVSLPVKSRPTPATRLASMSHIPAKLKWKVFQACNAKDEAKLEINNNYMLIGSDGPACSCVIRKSSHQRLLIGNHDCFKLLCKNETKCLNKEEMWIEFRITCAKKKCAYTTFLVEDTTEATHVNVSVETSIACGLKPLTKIDTKPSDHLCYAGHATHTVLLQCYRNHTPPVEIKTIPPYVGLSPPKAINYLFGYQGPYKLLDPYKKGDNYSTGCSCKINVPKGFNIRVYRGCKCVGVECKQSTKCRISNDAIYHATVINGPADVTVNYTDTKLCSSCDQETYFAVDVGRNGKVTYSCGSAHKVKLPSLTSGIPDIGLPVMGAAAVIGLLLIICVVCVCRKMCKRSRASDRAPLAKR